MSRYLVFFQTISFFILILVAGSTGVSQAAGDYVPGEIIVRYKNTVSSSAVVQSLSARGTKRIGGSEGLNIHFVKVTKGTTVEQAIQEYLKDPDVLYAEPNYRVHALTTDAHFDEQWGLKNTGQTTGPFTNRVSSSGPPPYPDIDAEGAWGTTTGSSATVIAVLDTGMDMNHPDLDDQLWTNPGETDSNTRDDDGNGYVDDINGWNFVNNDNDPDDDNVRTVSSLNNHGTHICGIIGAETDNLIGVAGVNWNVQLMILKVLDKDGNGTVANIITAIEYAVDKGVKIINASWGLTSFSQSLYNSIETAGNSGTLIVAAAGNTATVEYPARFNLDNIISVTATGLDDELTDFGTGTLAAMDVEDVDLGAPGYEIFSTFIATNAPSNIYGYSDYYWNSGTSQSVAFVTGVAGLLLSDDATLTADQIKARILDNTVQVADLATVTVSGGRLDAAAALAAPVVITPLDTGLNVGETQQFALDGATATSWSSSDSAVGTIDSNGLFTAVGAGTCTITANPGPSTSKTIFVRAVTVSTSATSLKSGQSATLTPSGGTTPYTWSSSSSSVLSVNSNGIITGAGTGTATVTATDATGFFGISETITVTSSGSSGSGGNCFIATAAFGSPMERHVRILQEFRDQYLLTNRPGRTFVRFYYRYSPPLADWIGEKPLLRAAVRTLLTPLVLFGSLMMKTGLTWKGLFVFMGLMMLGTGLIFRNYSATSPRKN